MKLSRSLSPMKSSISLIDCGVAQKSSRRRLSVTWGVLVGCLSVSALGLRGLAESDPEALHLLESRSRHAGALAFVKDQPSAAAPLLDHSRVVEDLRNLLVARHRGMLLLERLNRKLVGQSAVVPDHDLAVVDAHLRIARAGEVPVADGVLHRLSQRVLSAPLRNSPGSTGPDSPGQPVRA